MSVPVLKLWLQPLCIPAGKHTEKHWLGSQCPWGHHPHAWPPDGCGVTPRWSPPTCAGTWWERVWNSRLGNGFIMPLHSWDAVVGWECWVKVSHLLRSLPFTLDAPGRWKGTILYFPQFWGIGAKLWGRRERVRWGGIQMCHLSTYCFMSEMWQGCWGLSLCYLPAPFYSWQERRLRPVPCFSHLWLWYCLLGADLIWRAALHGVLIYLIYSKAYHGVTKSWYELHTYLAHFQSY